MHSKRNKLLILTASGFSFFGNGMHFIALSWLVLQITDDPLYVSILVVLGIIPGILSSPFAGVAADRFNKKFIVISTDIIRFLTVLSLPLIGLSKPSLWVLYIAVIIITLSSNFFFPAMSAIIKSSFNKEEYLGVLSANSTLMQIGVIGGSGLAGIIIAQFSIELVFFIDAATYFISAILLLFLKYKDPIKSAENINDNKVSIFTDLKLGLQYVATNKTIIFLFLIGIMPNAITHIINSLLGAYTKDVLNMGASAYGILDASFAIGFVTIGIVLGLIKKKLNEKSLLTYGFLILSIGMCLLALSNTFMIGILSLFLIGVALILTGPSRKSLLMKQVDDKFVGRVESLNWMMFSSISPILAILASFFSTYLGLQNVFLILSISLLVLFFVCKLSFASQNKALRNTEAA